MKVVEPALLLGLAFELAGCAALMNYGRPKYDGPILEPLWHVADMQVIDTPVVRGGVVYAVGQAWNSGDGHVYAFDAKTGKKMWIAGPSAARIVAEGPHLLFTDDGHGVVRALDMRSGLPAKFAVPHAFGFATYADGTLYVAGTSASLGAYDANGRAIWSATLPVRPIGAPQRPNGRYFGSVSDLRSTFTLRSPST